jgi:hypothetical protein
MLRGAVQPRIAKAVPVNPPADRDPDRRCRGPPTSPVRDDDLALADNGDATVGNGEATRPIPFRIGLEHVERLRPTFGG